MRDLCLVRITDGGQELICDVDPTDVLWNDEDGKGGWDHKPRDKTLWRFKSWAGSGWACIDSTQASARHRIYSARWAGRAA